ncbi:uncharacterized protein LOC143869753 [Tasmannia lanceolata]|uniref:uncharacterized protein LOC143869753 n=1 Tax=Tasmannia lanceolata TaxID=3420 RepID=UPI00406300F6
MVCIEGGYVEQYARVWDYCDLISSRNLGSCVKLKVERPTLDVMPTFQSLYVSLHAMRQGFLASCKPFIGLDGCHLKGPWGRQILSAVGKDVNEQMFPIAYAVVEAELKESWTWFLRTLLDDIGSVETYGWTFIFDRQKGLVETFEEILPNADHRFCVRHMYNNFKAEFKGKLLKDTMWSAAYPTTPIEFQKKVEEMEKLDKKAHAYLQKINPTLWSRSAFNPKPKCNLLVNNLSETFNGFILPARDKPILTLLETIRRLLMGRFQKQRSTMDKYEGPICPKIQEKLEKLKMGACDCHVEWSSGEEYEVQRHGKQYVVNLAKTCWDLTRLPCIHAIAAIFYQKEPVENFVHPYYHTDAFRRSYREIIHPMPSIEQWPLVDMEVVQPPPVRRPPGRAKKLRRRDADDP